MEIDEHLHIVTAKKTPPTPFFFFFLFFFCLFFVVVFCFVCVFLVLIVFVLFCFVVFSFSVFVTDCQFILSFSRSFESSVHKAAYIFIISTIRSFQNIPTTLLVGKLPETRTCSVDDENDFH